MSSTNKTPNYDLSQYVGTDKPTYLGDYNGDMLKIDAQMKANNDAATGAAASAGEAVAKATTAQNDVDALEPRMNSAETSITQMQNSITSMAQNINNISEKADAASTAAQGATTAAESASEKANTIEAGFDNWIGGACTVLPAFINRGVNAYENQMMGLFNIYGTLGTNSPTTVGTTIVFGSLPANIRRPSNKRTIVSAATLALDASGGSRIPVDLTISTDGTLSVDNPLGSAVYAINIQVLANEHGWFTV